MLSIQDLGSIGELVAAVATIATLIYLAIQIRHNTNQTRLLAVRDSSDQFTNFALTIGSTPELRSAMIRVRTFSEERRDDLSTEDWLNIEMVLRAVFNTANKDFMTYKSGIADEGYWFQVRDFLVFAMFPSKLVLDWWNTEVIPASSYDQEFRDWGNTQLRKLHPQEYV